MNLSDQIVNDQLKHQIELDRLKANVSATVLASIVGLEGEIVAQLNKVDPTGTGNLRFRKSRTNKLVTAVDGAVNVHFGAMDKAVKEKLLAIAQLESELTIGTINSLVGLGLLEQVLSKSEIRTILDETLMEGATNADWWKSQNAGLKDKFAREMRMGVALGETTQALTRRVRKRFPRSLLFKSAKETTGLVRTAVQAIANESRLRTFQANNDVIKAIQWISTLDTRTTDICIGLSNKQWSIEKSGLYVPIDHDKAFPGPIAHWACRSTQIAITKSWDELNKKGALKRKGKRDTRIDDYFRRELVKQGKSPREVQSIMRKARASMDGQVAVETTFEQFWSRMSKSEQIARFGRTRTELFREGRLKFEDLTDQSNRPRTLEEIYKVL